MRYNDGAFSEDCRGAALFPFFPQNKTNKTLPFKFSWSFSCLFQRPLSRSLPVFVVFSFEPGDPDQCGPGRNVVAHLFVRSAVAFGALVGTTQKKCSFFRLV